jgi:hypothetical protein
MSLSTLPGNPEVVEWHNQGPIGNTRDWREIVCRKFVENARSKRWICRLKARPFSEHSAKLAKNLLR